MVYQQLNGSHTTLLRSQFQIVDPVDPDIQHLQEKDRLMKSRVRKLRIIMRILAFACSVVVVALMTHNLVVYYSTINAVAQGQRLWPTNPKLWPTYVMLGVAALSSILATIVLLAYLWGTKAANRWNTVRFGLSMATIGFLIVMWAIAAGGMQSTSDFDGTGSQSLWSATCDASDQTHELFGHTVDFSRFCLEQQWGVVCAGIGIALEGLTVVSYIYVFLRLRHRKHMKEVITQPPAYLSPFTSPQPSPYFDGKFPRLSEASSRA